MAKKRVDLRDMDKKKRRPFPLTRAVRPSIIILHKRERDEDSYYTARVGMIR